MRTPIYVVFASVFLLACTGCPPAPIASVPSTAAAPATVDKLPASTVTGSVDPLKVRLEAAIDMVRGRGLDQSHGFWTVFHGILGLGPDLKMTDSKTGRQVKALDYIRLGGEMPGLRFDVEPQGVDVFTATDRDRFFAQGHQDQFVAEMAQWGVPLDLAFKVNGKDFTFRDFVRFSKARASTTRNQELAWAIHVISEYDGTELTWTNQFGEKVTFADLMRYELDSPLDAEQCLKRGLPPLACGGTHRFFGLTWALHIHQQKQSGPLTGVWKDAADRIDALKKQAKSQQNPDGSFSTLWFMGRGDNPDPSQRLNTSGHIFEWLALALSDEELREPWVQQAASYLSKLFLELRSEAVEGGSLYHAVHGLLIYYARVYGTEKLGDNTPYLRMPPAWKQVVRK
jgi:hypothetical protein